jgi:hypothetical protein
VVSKSYKSRKPCRRWFLGYSEFEIHTALPVERVLKILSENVQPQKKFFQLKSKPFLGCVNSKEFVIKHNSSFMQRVYGNINQEGEGSIVVFTMREDMWSVLAYFLFFVFTAPFVWWNISYLAFYAIFVFGLRIFYYILFRFDAVFIRRKLLRILM